MLNVDHITASRFYNYSNYQMSIMYVLNPEQIPGFRIYVTLVWNKIWFQILGQRFTVDSGLKGNSSVEDTDGKSEEIQ